MEVSDDDDYADASETINIEEDDDAMFAADTSHVPRQNPLSEYNIASQVTYTVIFLINVPGANTSP